MFKDFKGIYDSSSHTADLLKSSQMDAHGQEDQTTLNFNQFYKPSGKKVLMH